MREQLGVLNRFRHDRRGAVAMIFGISAIVLVLMVGLAIDGGRAYSVAAKVGSALDAAALAGAKQLNETDNTDDQVTVATLATLDAHIANIPVTNVTFTNKAVSIDRANSAVTVSAHVAVSTMFGGVGGIRLLDFDKSSTTSYDMAQIEMVLALDTTGSMLQVPSGDTQDKITSLRSAATDIVNSLYDLASTDSNIRIGLVPWSASVNAGEYSDLATGTVSTSGWSRLGWGWVYTGPNNCVLERSGSGATNDDAPSGANFAAEASASTPCPTQEIAPMIGRNQRAAMLSTIAGLTANGGTAGHIGTAWGWYLISPNWAPYFPAESQPAPYNSRTIKNVVIMTDGIFNTDYVGGSASGGYDDTSYTLFQQNCAGMRAKGINVYTILFDLSDARAVSELQACAGVPGNFYNAANASQLRTAFADIVKRLNVVRVSR